jgi:signal transduction histidine kinase
MDGIESPRIEIARALKDGAVELSVTDNGPGIPEDRLEQIFDPFYTTKAPGEGTGLGLAVSRSLMEAMGGDLTVASVPGQGACFTIRLARA